MRQGINSFFLRYRPAVYGGMQWTTIGIFRPGAGIVAGYSADLDHVYRSRVDNGFSLRADVNFNSRSCRLA